MAQRAVDAILAEARAEIAAGRFPDVIALRAELAGDADALVRLDRVLAVHRARARVAREPVPGTRPRLLQTRPTVRSDMDVRRAGEFRLEWDASTSVADWEVRISERPDQRGDYIERETLHVDTPSVELSLGEQPTRVSIVGRSANGRLVRRATISGLTRETWNDRWNRR